MNKKLLTLILCTMLIGGLAVSCGADPEEPNNQEQPNEKPDDKPNDKPDDKPDTPNVEPVFGELFNPYPNVPTPIEAYVNKVADNTGEGVEIEVTKIEDNNFVFNVRPGEFVQSYRLDVFPLCRLYNSLFEQMNAAGKTTATERDIDTWIRDFVFNSTGAGAYTFSPAQHSDYEDKEFDWMNTSYSQAHIVPDAEYIIVAVACFDSEGMEDGEMSMCYVRTDSKPLIGNPRIEFDVKTTFRAFEVTHIPNEDCKYLYYFASDEADLMPYINTYGRKLYIDFMRHTIGEAVSANDINYLSYYKDFGQFASADAPIMATAIALDENQTPATEFDEVVFTLMPIPDNMQPGKGEIKVVEDKVGAGYFWYEYSIEPNTYVVLWQMFTPEQAEYYKTQASQDELISLALKINDEGWGLVNQNYSYDEETDTYGRGYTGREVFYATPNTEHVMGYIARNRAQQLSEIHFTEPIKTKPYILDTPEACESDCKMTLTSNSRTNVTIKFDYDFEKHAGVHFQYFEPVLDNAHNITADSSREEFLSFLGYTGASNNEMGGVPINNWNGEPMGVDSFTVVLDPNTTYKYAAMFEDWNGVVSDVVIGEVSTKAIVPGDNPVANITAEIVKDERGNDAIKYTFSCNEDTSHMLYLSGTINDENDPLYLQYLGTGNMIPEEYEALWRQQCMDLGLTTQSLNAYLDVNASEVSVAVCIPFGKDGIRGEMTHLIWDGKETKTLKDYYPEYYTE